MLGQVISGYIRYSRLGHVCSVYVRLLYFMSSYIMLGHIKTG